MCVCVNVVSDTMDSILADSDEEDEQDAVISQVLDEIGIEVTSKVSIIVTMASCDHLLLHGSSCQQLKWLVILLEQLRLVAQQHKIVLQLIWRLVLLSYIAHDTTQKY